MENVKVASVKYIDGFPHKTYDFFTDIEDLRVGDTVVVDSVNGLGLAKVELVVKQSPYSKANKWIVQKVDLSSHEARIRKEKLASDLKKKMEARRKKLEQNAIYKMMAETDPEMAELLKQYEEVLN